MSDTPTPPAPGTRLWGDDLNAYLLSLEARIAVNEQRFATYGPRIYDLEGKVTQLEGRVTPLESKVTSLEGQVTSLADQVTGLTERVVVLEARPEYVFGQAAYQFTNAAPPATGSQIRLNNVNPQLVTMMDVRRLDTDGQDRTVALEMITPGTLIRLQDFNDATKWYRYLVSGYQTMGAADNFNIPVTWHSGLGTLPNAKISVSMLIVIPHQAPPEVTHLEEPAP
jgi:uncharacterized coiled-coil protein SlyX